MSKIVDIYIPLDERNSACAAVWPVAQKQLKEIISVIKACGWTPNVLNPKKPVPHEAVIREMVYNHPIYTPESLSTQAGISGMNGLRNTYFCGSYLGNGFHEDAVRAGWVCAVGAAGRGASRGALETAVAGAAGVDADWVSDWILGGMG